MRVIAGTLGGRQFDAPKGQRTHPMSDKVRGGLFNTLGDISGLNVLDAFAGSGALSLEAISRGAAHATAIDIDKNAHQTLMENVRQLDVDDAVKSIRANASGWSDNNLNSVFDLVFAAPPYDDLRLPLLQKLTKHVKDNGLYVLDWPGKSNTPEFEGLEVIKEQDYGDAKLVFYRKIS
ncbi:MAG TPA: 16S rRNA (guanine(966)-N(2))-methyltransferase RsmD [Patescibacteria group bacterium]|nr:16S rRNA (guanine(966)-N(2))-methyltransferase RsmD [Patescibacteria group bacterium]